MMEEFQMEETNNYEKWCEQWREKFLKMDQEELKKRLLELKEEGDWLTLCHFGRRLGVHKENGKIMAMEDQDPVTCYERSGRISRNPQSSGRSLKSCCRNVKTVGRE